MTLKGHLQALITIAVWSSTFIVSKILLGQMTPLQILFCRFLIAIVFLSILHPRFTRPVSLREELLFLAIGAALASYFIFENSALQRTYSSNVSLIVATIPLLTGIMSMVVYKSRFFTIKSTAGLIVASSLAFILWNQAIKAIGSVKTNQYIYLIPVMTTAVSAIVLHERITLMTLLGTVLILSGLYLSEKSQAGGQDSTKEKGPDARWI
jgi:drug/metabolite transporter (DMT)-like permease